MKKLLTVAMLLLCGSLNIFCNNEGKSTIDKMSVGEKIDLLELLSLGVTANSLSFPQSVIVDGSGNLFVIDYYNCRVLYYLSGSTTATRVYGQPNFTTNNSRVIFF